MMKIILSIGLLLLLICDIVFFEKIKELFLTWGFSFTFSFLSAFILNVILSLALAYILLRNPRDKNAVRKIIFTVFIVGVPFLVTFIIHPIYEGDLNKSGTALSNTRANEEFRSQDLVILTIPNCPFCKESVKKINMLQKRNPKLKIKYIVCTSNQEYKNELRKFLNPKINLDIAYNLSDLIDLSEGKFPCFVKVSKSKAKYKWHNNQFGTSALDRLEQVVF